MGDSTDTSTSPWRTTIDKHAPDLKPYEDLYKHLHQNPELSDQEEHTAASIAEHLKKLSPDLKITTHVGGHGLFAVLSNGPGKTILLRADIDALPVKEDTGLPYSSTKTMKDKNSDNEEIRPVMHACGHDMHIACALATAELLTSARASWSGTAIFLFQPAEERGTGARAMVADGLYDSSKHGCPIPDICLGQHVMPELTGRVLCKSGVFMSAADSFRITIFGRGGHGSMPHRTTDPVLIASHVVVRLQSIVSREVPPSESAVVTVGAVQAGTTENIIPDRAVVMVDIRSQSSMWRTRILESVRRIVRAECDAGKCPKEPLFERTRDFPLTINHEETLGTVTEAFGKHFGDHFSTDLPAVLGSEDFGILGSAIDRPYVFWVFGGVGKEEWEEREKAGTLNELPVNHSPFFAPVIQPTLKTGMEALAVAFLGFAGKKDE